MIDNNEIETRCKLYLENILGETFRETDYNLVFSDDKKELIINDTDLFVKIREKINNKHILRNNINIRVLSNGLDSLRSYFYPISFPISDDYYEHLIVCLNKDLSKDFEDKYRDKFLFDLFYVRSEK